MPMTREEKEAYARKRGGSIDYRSVPPTGFETLAEAHRAEERAAWVAFAAAGSSWGGVDAQGNAHCNHGHDAAMLADAMLAEYRARFGTAPSEDA